MANILDGICSDTPLSLLDFIKENYEWQKSATRQE